MIVYYSSASRNTERFCNKLEIPSVRVDEYDGGSYILVTPTYADTHGNHPVPKPVIRFLNLNRSNMVGVIGAGNRNFGLNFALGGRFVAYKCGVPLLHRLELSGTEADINIVRKIHADYLRSS